LNKTTNNYVVDLVVSLTGISAGHKGIFIIEMRLGREKVAVPRAAGCLNTLCEMMPPGPHDGMDKSSIKMLSGKEVRL
jgi:hypothetical protein